MDLGKRVAKWRVKLPAWQGCSKTDIGLGAVHFFEWGPGGMCSIKPL